MTDDREESGSKYPLGACFKCLTAGDMRAVPAVTQRGGTSLCPKCARESAASLREMGRSLG